VSITTVLQTSDLSIKQQNQSKVSHFTDYVPLAVDRDATFRPIQRVSCLMPVIVSTGLAVSGVSINLFMTDNTVISTESSFTITLRFCMRCPMQTHKSNTPKIIHNGPYINE
jgi:hypothetical protein